MFRRLKLFLALSKAAALFAQTGDSIPHLEVGGEVLQTLRLSLEDLQRLPASTAEVQNRDKQRLLYRGVALHEVLKLAGVTLGEELRGESLAKFVVFQAADGYEVVFSLAELDPAFTDKQVLLAFEVDGKPIPKGQGPFRLVVPDEKRQARWIRELRKVKVEVFRG